ncbi:MAG: ABC transporter permease, partial [Holophagales bacterium]|nr:ABC transporter permease [Holophagales bacterium]
MTGRDVLRMAADNLAAHKLRSALTLLGVVFGVGAVIAMLAIGAGAEAQALQSISRLGLHNVVVRAKVLAADEAEEVRAKSVGVSLRDAEAIRDAVPGVERVTPVVAIDPWSVLSDERTAESARVLGVPGDYPEVVSIQLSEGRFLDARDVMDHAQVAVIGDEIRRELFGSGQALGRWLKIEDVWMEVIGVLASSAPTAASYSGGGNGAAESPVAVEGEGRRIYIPVSTAMRKLDHKPLDAPLSEIVVKLEEAESARRAATTIARLLGGLHAGADDYELVVPEALLAESRRTQRMFSLVMGCIAGISLLVGGIGIMNIMLASVTERTKEIGIRRAIGAKRKQIVGQFLIETVVLSVSGGFIGIGIGMLIPWMITIFADMPTAVTMWSVLLSVVISVGVGVIFG